VVTPLPPDPGTTLDRVPPAATTPTTGVHQHAHLHDGHAPHVHAHDHAHPAVDPASAGPDDPAARWVAVEHLHFAYPDGYEALRGIDLAIARGEKVALVGPNGAGKSSLLLHLNGIHLPAHGSVSIGGVVVDRSSAPRIRAEVGLVFQDPDDQLFSPTVGEDVAFGPMHMGVPKAEIHGRVEAALAAVGMAGFERRVPHHLSLGQRKRVAIATVLSMDPSVLAFDEPTAGLDPRGRRELMRLMTGLPQTLLVSTHDMAMVRDTFPRMIVLDGGLVVADGPTDAILADDALLEAHGLERP
jgi:cobalt/nickel transport system ATP-binding protein